MAVLVQESKTFAILVWHATLFVFKTETDTNSFGHKIKILVNFFYIGM
jgi:hypothetical protein